MGDFNVEVDNRNVEEFCKNYNVKSLIRVPTFAKTQITIPVLMSYWQIRKDASKVSVQEKLVLPLFTEWL